MSALAPPTCENEMSLLDTCFLAWCNSASVVRTVFTARGGHKSLVHWITIGALRKMEREDLDQYGHPRIPHRGHYELHRCIQRREWAEKFASCSLKHVGEWWKDEGADESSSCNNLKGNVENPIGLAKIPLGLAGPLMIHGDHVKGYLLCPFATTEGALVASVTRGAAALTRSGGVRCRALEKVMTRSPVFVMRSLDEAESLWRFLQRNFYHLKEQVGLYSQHADLLEIVPYRFGRMLAVGFKFATGDAAGQNMVTTGTWNACKWVLKTIPTELPDVEVVRFFIEANLSADKKMSAVNMFETKRGVNVVAEAWIPASVLRETLKVKKYIFLYNNLFILYCCTGVLERKVFPLPILRPSIF